MLKRENRLVSKRKLKGFKSIVFPQFILKIKKNDLSINRFGTIISKKIDKKAVGRNKIKRFFSTVLSDLDRKTNKGNDLLFIVKKEILKKNKEENVLAIKEAVKEIGFVEK